LPVLIPPMVEHGPPPADPTERAAPTSGDSGFRASDALTFTTGWRAHPWLPVVCILLVTCALAVVGELLIPGRNPVVVKATALLLAALSDWRTASLSVLFAIAVGGFAAYSARKARQTRAQQAQLDTAINNIRQGLVMFDASKRVIVCNRRYIEMYGLSPDVVKPGCRLCDLLKHRKEAGNFSGDADQYIADVMAAIERGKTATTIVETPDRRIFRIINQPIADGGWVATHEDITDQVKLERQRDRTQKFLDLIVENVPSTIVVKKAGDLRYALLNRAAEAYYGVARDKMLGKTPHEVLPWASAEYVAELDRKLLSNHQQPLVDEHTLEMSGGEKHVALSKRLCIRDEKGEPQYLLAVVDDITAQVEAKTKLQEQKLQLDSALNNMSQGLCMFDADQRLIVCNKRYADLYGLSEEQTRPGTTLREILAHRIAVGNAPEDHEAYLRDRINEVSINQPYQTTNRLRDGRQMRVVHRPMANGGWVATHEDITEATRREESFRLLFDGNPVPMWVFEQESKRFIAVNDAAVAHYGYSREQFLAMTVFDLRPLEDRDQFAQHLQALPDFQVDQNFVKHLKSDGTAIHVSVLSCALTYAGQPARLAAVRDITKVKQAEDELNRTKKFLDTVIEHVPLPIAVKQVADAAREAKDCPYALVNRAYEELTGKSRAELIGQCARELYTKERAGVIIESDVKTLRSNEAVLMHEHPIVTPQGTRIVTAKKTAIRDDGGRPQYLLSVLDDVTERRRAEQRISYLAHNDVLTDLPNRVAFNEYIAAKFESAAKTNEPFAILSADLDRFKEANDVYGHSIGDALLRAAARRLQAAAQDTFLARIGGDEFVLVASGPQPEATAALGDRLLEAFRSEFEVEGHRLKLGVSIGAAVYPADGTDVKTLIGNADAALYRAKTETRGTVRFFEAELSVRLRERRALQEDLRYAVDRGQLHLHYQPQEKMSGAVVGFEALARWQCPNRGVVTPATFIPIAEESNLIIPIGEWILRAACREAVSWTQPLTVAVNISPIQFRIGDLPRLVHAVLLETGLAPHRLELEITEGVMIGDFSRAVSILNKLKALGVKIAMDDFGSGYSSLSYLHAFPFDKIKIDRLFVNDLEQNHHSMAIVRAVIGLGHSLNVPILAEGVETQAQHAFLVHEGCDEVQGYLTGRPGPIDDYADLVGPRRLRRLRRVVTVG
jgi:diguanylate cyclase (GGDEF)-like protein/PAS domain S-box-containing protein